MGTRLERIGIVGAGVMGHGIAQVCAAAGCKVKLFDTNGEAIARGIHAIREDLAQAVKRNKLTEANAAATLSRMEAAGDMTALADCDMVVEAIIEKLEPKQALFRALESIVQRDCVLATNTSSLSVTAIASVCLHSDRVAGWHFFNPVPRMKVVEIIQAPRTRQDVVDALAELSGRIGHRAVVASDSPGFVVNHAGRAYVTEGLKLLSEGAADHPVLDAIMRTCAGFRMGPFELLDLTGLDVSVPVMESIHSQYYGDDRYRPAMLARTRLLAGLLGRKSGQGFYNYNDKPAAGKAQVPEPTSPSQGAPWWTPDGEGALPDSLATLLPSQRRAFDPGKAELILLAPTRGDLTSAVAELQLEPSLVVGVDPCFSGATGATLMVSPATTPAATAAAQALFAAASIPSFVVSDSPGFVAPRIVACIVNLACEMAQQRVASPADIDAAVKLGLGYPYGPFEWGDRLGAARVLHILQGLYATFGDQRYRPSPWLVRRARLALPLAAPDRAAS